MVLLECLHPNPQNLWIWCAPWQGNYGITAADGNQVARQLTSYKEITWWAHCHHEGPLNMEEEVEDSVSWHRFKSERLRPPTAGFEQGRGPGAKECSQPLGSRKGRETDRPPELPEGFTPANMLILAQGDPFLTSDLQNLKKINLYRFQSSGLW